MSECTLHIFLFIKLISAFKVNTEECLRTCMHWPKYPFANRHVNFANDGLLLFWVPSALKDRAFFPCYLSSSTTSSWHDATDSNSISNWTLRQIKTGVKKPVVLSCCFLSLSMLALVWGITRLTGCVQQGEELHVCSQKADQSCGAMWCPHSHGSSNLTASAQLKSGFRA